MYGIKITRTKDEVIFTVKLSGDGDRDSGSGKNRMYASSEGNQPLPGAGDFKYGLNVYAKKEQ